MIGILLTFSIVALSALAESTAPGCHHPIFCNDTILAAVAKTSLYSDSKTFVDLVLKVSIQEAQKQFESKTLLQFLQNCFTTNNTILVPLNLTDYKPNPQPLALITNPDLKLFALDLNKRWNQLARRVDLNYKTNCPSQCSSFLEEMDGRLIIVPGGRFQECYYWDTYWIIKGLLACEMLDTAFSLIENFILVIQKYGFIPNGFRQYYLNRSQPPFFALMVQEVAQALKNRGLSERIKTFQQQAFPALVKQHEFFMGSHSKTYKLKSGKEIYLNYYNAETTTPRPESYRQDAALTKNLTDEEKKRVLKGISSMAESGWDFSSRWLTDPTDLKTTAVNDIFPSDLNTLMGLGENYLSALSLKFGRTDLNKYFQSLLSDRKEYFAQKFNGRFYPDHSSSRERRQGEVFPSDFYPFLLLPQQAKEQDIYKDIVNPVTSSISNGMQWDSPNVWAPNNWIMHEVLAEPGRIKYAQQWVSTVYCSWKKQGLIYEKYRNDKLGERGQGGEYAVQAGFGWTNGLALYYLSLYGDVLQVPNCP